MRLREITLPELNGGINTHDPEYSIEDNQSPKMLNLWYKDKALSKRDGQTLVITQADAYKISGLYNGFRAVHAGTSLYKWNGTLTQIKTGIEDSAGVFVEFGDMLFYMDGAEIWQISDAYTVTAVDPYEPVVMINCLPDLSESTDNESYNLISGGFCVHYHGDALTTTYDLPLSVIDNDTVSVVVDAVDLEENTNFTVNRTDGTVNFSGGTSPHGAPNIGTNNIWITAYKDYDKKSRITGCKVALPFGGESSGVDGGSRVFVMSNDDYPLKYWRSDLGLNQSYGMTYFPDTSEEMLDQNSDPICTAAKMEGELIVFKTNSIFAIGYAFDGENVFHPVRECHSSIGCDMPGSVQLIDNRLVFCNTQSGVYTLISSSNRLENTVKPLSANINSLLFSQSELSSACSVDFERYYWLCVGDKVFLWDYEQTPYTNYSDYEKAQRRLAWYAFDGIDANDFCADGDLYYASDNGIVQFTKNKNDFDGAFEAYFTSKAFDLNNPNVKKTFMELYPSFRSDGDVKATVRVGNEKTDNYMSRGVDIRSFDWDDFSWGAFTWNIIKFTKTIVMKLRMKMVSYLQVEVVGNEINRSFGLTGIRITYYLNRKVKR